MNENRMCELAEMKEKLISCMQAEISKGVENVDTKEAGEVIDIIKDIAQCEKYCWEAEYYKEIVEAMEDDEDETEYQNRSGYYRPKKSSKYARPYRDHKPYIDAYFNDPNFRENMRMGYDHSRTDSEKITDMMNHIREIWRRADPELKVKMRTDFDSLLGEMK